MLQGGETALAKLRVGFWRSTVAGTMPRIMKGPAPRSYGNKRRGYKYG